MLAGWPIKVMDMFSGTRGKLQLQLDDAVLDHHACRSMHVFQNHDFQSTLYPLSGNALVDIWHGSLCTSPAVSEGA